MTNSNNASWTLGIFKNLGMPTRSSYQGIFADLKTGEKVIVVLEDIDFLKIGETAELIVFGGGKDSEDEKVGGIGINHDGGV